MIMVENTLAEYLFNQFCERYKSRDMSALLDLFSSNITMWGTGLDEYRVGLTQVEEQLKRDWSQSEKGAIEVISFVPTATDAKWAAAVCHARITIDGKEYVFEELRGTIVIDKENEKWKISHMHASFPDYRNAQNGSFPAAS